jgi:hypothetical protein
MKALLSPQAKQYVALIAKFPHDQEDFWQKRSKTHKIRTIKRIRCQTLPLGTESLQM